MSTMAQNSSNRGGKAHKATGRQGKMSEGSTACPSCASRIQDNARYCQNCGKSLDNTGWLTSQTLTILAAAIIVLIALALLFASVIDIDRLASNGPMPTSTPRTAASGQPPDLSSMTAREAADRLFNRVMMADEQGNTEEVNKFTPMAVSAYGMLERLDTDALFHVGLVQAAAGDIEEARSYNERLKAIVPNHLLAALLEYRLAKAENKARIATGAVKRFHDHYDEEISVGRSEYEHHRASIESFRASTSESGAGDR